MADQSKDKKSPETPSASSSPRTRFNGPATLLTVALLVFLGVWFFGDQGPPRSEITYDFFRRQLQQGNIESVEIEGLRVFGKFKTRPMKPEDPDETTSAGSPAQADKSTDTKKPVVTKNDDDDASAESTDGDKGNAEQDGKNAKDEGKYEEFFSTVFSPLVGEQLDQELIAAGVVVKSQLPRDTSTILIMLYLGMTVALVVLMWVMFRRARDQMMGGGGLLSGFSKSPAQRYEATKQRTTFKDVAGLENVKRDLQEVVEFLKDPEKFQRLGGRVPKGVLLNGPPGTGKTLLARAVAGEANVPFFSINGSEFIQMFVGVGASRVRDMFKTAKEAEPAILFIDEIDAVGRVRGAGLGGGHDEREQTLNQILSEMDGFEPNESVIVLAATNRPDVLDPALLRPGRFDRHVTVDRPTQKGRTAIFGVHVRDVPLADDVDLERLAKGTVGLTGADIRNLVNEAALWATREGKDKVDMDSFEHARDKILMGPKREEVLSEKEKEVTAYHESGHALLAWLVPGNDRLHKVTVIPRGRALGVTQLLPEEDRLNYRETDLLARLVFILGGRAAEKLVYGEYSAGAENDLSQATQIARRMVAHWGMSERLGPVAYHLSEEHPFLGKEIHEQRKFSEHTAQLIDEEVARLLHESAAKAETILREKRPMLDKLARALIEAEVLDEEEVAQLIGPSINGPDRKEES